jgi:hypothetical protein
MPDVAGGWVHSLLRTLGGNFGRDMLYLGIWVIHTHLGCFDAQGEVGGGAMEFAMRSRSPGSQLGKQCQLDLGSELLLGSLGSVFLGKKMYIVVNTV